MKLINWIRRDWFSALLTIAVTTWLVLAALGTLGTSGDPYDDTPNRIPVAYPHQ